MNIKTWLRIKKFNLNLYRQNLKNKYIEADLKGGLCNKLHCLFSLCDIALKKKAYIVEPNFGWKEKILFSDIYDIDFFNKKINEIYGVKEIIIPRIDLNNRNIENKIVKSKLDLWRYSELELAIERKSCKISKESTKLKVLKSLKLKPEYEKLVKKYTKDSFTAIQVRTESDWVEYSKRNKVEDNEQLLVTLPILIEMLKEFEIDDKLFFTSGENHQVILKSLKEININPFYYYDSYYEYEINAAINFEICCKSKSYIGLSRSSYSNLISLKRAVILNNDNSYIYNYKTKIHRRIDKGLHPVASDSVTKETFII